jgi:hypothetical protein
MEINVRELYNGAFQFFLWSNKEVKPITAAQKNDISNLSHEENSEYHLIGECYIGINKFYFGEVIVKDLKLTV